MGFLKDVLGEVIDLFPNSPYIHIGGDETDLSHWKASPVVRAIKEEHGLADERQALRWFIGQIADFAASKDKKLICWDDVLDNGFTVNSAIMSWHGYPAGADAARSGHEVIMTPSEYTYFDHPQADSNEPLSLGPRVSLRDVYNFDPKPPGISAADSKNIIGGEACLWTEFIKTPEHAEYMAFPRMLALAEVLWSRPAASSFADRQQNARDFEDFTRRLLFEFPRLDKANVNYRLPEPYGLRDRELAPDEKAIVDLSSPIPGGKVYFTTDGTPPSRFSQEFRAPFVLPVDRGSTIEIKIVVVSPNGTVNPERSCKYTRK
jgi:hexosaminidase